MNCFFSASAGNMAKCSKVSPQELMCQYSFAGPISGSQLSESRGYFWSGRCQSNLWLFWKFMHPWQGDQGEHGGTCLDPPKIHWLNHDMEGQSLKANVTCSNLYYFFFLQSQIFNLPGSRAWCKRGWTYFLGTNLWRICVTSAARQVRVILKLIHQSLAENVGLGHAMRGWECAHKIDTSPCRHLHPVKFHMEPQNAHIMSYPSAENHPDQTPF